MGDLGVDERPTLKWTTKIMMRVLAGVHLVECRVDDAVTVNAATKFP